MEVQEGWPSHHEQQVNPEQNDRDRIGKILVTEFSVKNKLVEIKFKSNQILIMPAGLSLCRSAELVARAISAP